MSDHNPHARSNDLERIRMLQTALAARNRDISRLQELLERRRAEEEFGTTRCAHAWRLGAATVGNVRHTYCTACGLGGVVRLRQV